MRTCQQNAIFVIEHEHNQEDKLMAYLIGFCIYPSPKLGGKEEGTGGTSRQRTHELHDLTEHLDNSTTMPSG